MPPKQITPALGMNSYSCPHCGAIAAQHWFRILPKNFESKNRPTALLKHEARAIIQPKDEKAKKHWQQLLQRFNDNLITYVTSEYSQSTTWEMLNMCLSMCFSCEGFGIWVLDLLVWPVTHVVVEPHQDMPDDVKIDFIEAASIVNQSPRGSAALSRLAIQKLMVDLGEKGKDINNDIASLVSKGLETDVQQALDVVRVIGNSAVHPGKIDLRDDKATATTLLHLINLVVDRRISTQKRIAEIFNNLPPGALKQIEQRDAPKVVLRTLDGSGGEGDQK